MECSKGEKVPQDYHDQDGCYCCVHVFAYYEYDESDKYYCHVDKSNRPKCGSIFKKEKFADEKDIDLWNAWAKTHEVCSGSGICSNFTKGTINHKE